MFSEKLNQILLSIDTSAADLARFMSIDPSGISRLLTGNRIPRRGGSSIINLVNGIYSYADNHGKIHELCSLLSCSEVKTAEEIKQKMIFWLYEGEEPRFGNFTNGTVRAPYKKFGEKLDAAMELAGLSNVRFGKLINLDTSYISRFRNGLRSPKSNPQTMNNICQVLIDRLTELNKIGQLGALMGVNPDTLSDDEMIFSKFHDWLYDQSDPDNIPIVENLIEYIDEFRPDLSVTLPDVNSIITSVDNNQVYYGSDGLQKAVIRLLGTVLKSGAKELFLYSDQSMDWMTDQTFINKWAALMFECVKQGVRIKIIHNVDRKLNEMVSAISSWLPLYMSGMIESFYCKKQKNTRFSKTLFLCPDLVCVSGSNAVGLENSSGIFRYDTDQTILNYQKDVFDSLFTDCKPLVRISNGTEIESQVHAGNSGVTVMGTTLSLVTMNEKTLNGILLRNNIPEKQVQSILSARDFHRQLYFEKIKKTFVHEIMPVADDNQLFEGKIRVDIPEVSLTYTPQEYADHIREIMRISDSYINYRFFAIPDAPFSNTKISFSDNTVIVTRLKPPNISFIISHPAICEAFSAYAENIKKIYNHDKLTLNQLLKRYL